MTWGKVDDKLHGHPKVEGAGLEAMGLWVLALSHGCDYLLDGHVTPDRVARLAGGAQHGAVLAERLCEARLWHRADEECSSPCCEALRRPTETPGWRFHDWADHQPTRSGIEERRTVAAERQRRKREDRSQSVTPSVTRDSTRDIAVTSRSVTPSVTPLSGIGIGSGISGSGSLDPGAHAVPPPAPSEAPSSPAPAAIPGGSPAAHEILGVLRDSPMAGCARLAFAEQLERYTVPWGGKLLHADLLFALRRCADVESGTRAAGQLGTAPDKMPGRIIGFVTNTERGAAARGGKAKGNARSPPPPGTKHDARGRVVQGDADTARSRQLRAHFEALHTEEAAAAGGKH